MTSEEFLKLLTGANVVAPTTIDKLRRRVTEARAPVDPVRIAQKLIERGDLTSWQARQLMAGRNAFFLGRYQLLERIGAGGMGVVFRARHAVMDRMVAIKVMSRALLKRPTAVARFNREVKAAAALNHPNIIAAFDADNVGNTHFLVMEYVAGKDLNFWLRATGKFPISAACECTMQAAEGLQHAFRQGMVHRDIKPVNLLVHWNEDENRPVVKVLDMGLARFASEVGDEASLTRAGQTIGTPDYIAPEAADNFRQADIRADIFSLGCTLFRLLTGRMPYPGATTIQKLMARAKDDAPLASSLRPEVPAELDAVVAKMLARDPDDRYQTPAEVAEALAPFAASRGGDRAALAMFRDVPADPGDEGESLIDGDADTSLEEFFRDFSMAPLREDGAANEPAAKVKVSAPPGDALELAPDDDEALPLDAPVPKAAKAPAAVATKAPAAARTKSAAPAALGKAARPSPAPALTEDLLGPPGLGGIDDLLAGDPLDAGRLDAVDPLGTAVAPAEPQPETSRQTRRSRQRWDSNLILFGGGGLLLLVLAGTALLFGNLGQSAEKALADAEADYRNGLYARAIFKYDEYLEQHPKDTGASQARVHRGLARLHQAIDGNPNWSSNLQVAQEVLPQLEKEKEWASAAGEIAVLLPKLAAGLANAAREKQDPALIAQAREALALVDKYVVASMRPAQQLADVQATLALVEEELGQSAALTAGIEKIQAAIAAGQPDAAFAVRRELIKRYPSLESDAKLAEAVLAISAAQQQAVHVVSEVQPAAPAAMSEVTSLALASTGGKPAAGLEGRIFGALAQGAAWGLDAATGAPLWRRWVGATATVAPQPVGNQPGDDLLLHDVARNEAVRVAARDGAVKWRHALAAPAVGPAWIADGQAIVATQTGELVWLDLAAGSSPRRARLPQPLTTAPAADARGKHLYQPANHSSLFILSAADGACEEVYYLGHEAGTIVVPPVVVSRYVFLAENFRAADSRLRVVLVDEQGVQAKQVQQIDLIGRMLTPPAVAGRNLHLVTDRGAWYSFEIAQPGEGDALKLVVERAPAEGDPQVRYPVVRNAEAWVADRQLSRYALQTTRGRLVPEGVFFQNDQFLQPPEAAGDALLSVRRNPQSGVVTVAATAWADGATVWESRIAAPLLAAPWVSGAGDAVELIRGDGQLFRAGGAALSRGGVDAAPVANVEVTTPVSLPVEVLALGSVHLAAADPSGTRLLLARGEGQPALSWLPLADTLGGPLLAAGDAVVAPGRSGQVNLLDAATAQPAAQPFQPALEPGVVFHWQGAALGDGRFLLADQYPRMYLLELRSEPRQLAAIAQIDLEAPVRSPLAATGQTVYGVLAGGPLQAWSLPELTVGEQINLGGDAAWGPVAAGSLVLVATGDDQLIALGESGQQLWKVPLAHGRPVGSVSYDEQTVTLVAAAGVVQTFQVGDGQLQGELDLGQPAASGSLTLGDSLVVATSDGTLLVTPRSR